jgi:hypothetical protein
MEGQRVGEGVLGNGALPVPLLGGEWVAYWISQICNPPLVSAAGVVMTGYTLSARTAWLWAVIYGLLAILAPALYVLYLFRRGVISDLHLTVREERTRPLVVTLGAALAAWMVLYSGGAPQVLVTLAVANVLNALFFFGITLYWKISAHSAAAAALAFLALMLVGRMAMPLAASVLLIAWARVRMQHHTVGQTVAGAILGSSVLASTFYLWGM